MIAAPFAAVEGMQFSYWPDEYCGRPLRAVVRRDITGALRAYRTTLSNWGYPVALTDSECASGHSPINVHAHYERFDDAIHGRIEQYDRSDILQASAFDPHHAYLRIGALPVRAAAS